MIQRFFRSVMFLSLALLACRVTLGLYLALAGYGKLSRSGVYAWVHDDQHGFKALQPKWLPDNLALPYGYCVPYAEVLLGLLLILGLLGRLTAGLLFLLLASFTMALVEAKGWSGGGPVAMHTNFILLALCLLLMAMGPGPLSLDVVGHGSAPRKPQ